MASSLIKPLRTAFGLEHVSDDLITACANRVTIRCSKVDLTIYRRRTGQAALEYAACEAIVGAFRDYYPDRAHKFHIGAHWPHAHAVIRGNKAWIEISIGIDYEDPDEGLEVIEIQVDRHPKQISIREKIEDVLFHRDARTTLKAAPPLELVAKAPTKAREPAPVGRPIDPPKAVKPPVKPAPAGKAVPVRRK